MRYVLVGAIGLLLVVIITACKQSVRGKDTQSVPTQYRTDVQPILRRLPKLVGVTKCYWKGGQYGGDNRSVPGPGSYWMKGFVLINSNEAARISKAYQWNDAPAGWKPPMDTTILGIAPSKWFTSREYADSIKASDSIIVDVYLDKSHSLLYFEISL